jgi:hypothetical protein
MTATLPPITLDLAAILEFDKDRIESVTLVNGQTFVVNNASRTIELGPNWMLLRAGYGEEESIQVIAIAAIASVALR